MVRKIWISQDEKDEICRRSKTGCTNKAIAIDFGLSNTTISNVLRERGFGPKHRVGISAARIWTARDQEQLESLLDLGVSPQDIADTMNRPLPTIQKRILEYHLRREGVSELKPGGVYKILQRVTRGVRFDDETRCRFIGSCRGAGNVVHYLFQSIAGGYIVAISDRQMVDYEIQEVEEEQGAARRER